MKFSWSIVPIAALAAAATVGGACNGGDSAKSPTAGGTPATIVTGSTPGGVSANVTPFATPQITGDQIVSTGKGYSATMPTGWHFKPNQIQTLDASLDAIFEPLLPGANVQANIAINCIVIKVATVPERIQNVKTTTAREGVNKNIQVSQSKVSGIDATVLTYDFRSPTQSTPPLDKQEFFFSNNKCDWTISTTTAAGDRPKYQAQFDAFVASFKLLP